MIGQHFFKMQLLAKLNSVGKVQKFTARKCENVFSVTLNKGMQAIKVIKKSIIGLIYY